MTTLALHTCCGPCLIEPLSILEKQFDRIVAVFSNSNIRPDAEYRLRHDTFVSYAQSQDLPYAVLEYSPTQWFKATAGARSADDRCKGCYEARFIRVAQWAQENGASHLATTLTVSPYQNQLAIAQTMQDVCEHYGFIYAGSDFSDHYPAAVKKSRQLGMYRQKYCGCLPSRDESG